MSKAIGGNLMALAAAFGLALAGAQPVAAQGQSGQEAAPAVENATGKGVIKAVNKEDHQLQITHDPIPALKWGSMTMAFKVAPSVAIDGLKPGTKVTFTLSKSPQGYVIEKIDRD